MRSRCECGFIRHSDRDKFGLGPVQLRLYNNADFFDCEEHGFEHDEYHGYDYYEHGDYEFEEFDFILEFAEQLNFRLSEAHKAS